MQKGEHYIVLAHPPDAAERAAFGADVTDTDSLATGMCGDGSRPFPVVEENGELRGIGPGREPQ